MHNIDVIYQQFCKITNLHNVLCAGLYDHLPNVNCFLLFHCFQTKKLFFSKPNVPFIALGKKRLDKTFVPNVILLSFVPNVIACATFMQIRTVLKQKFTLLRVCGFSFFCLFLDFFRHFYTLHEEKCQLNKKCRL